MTFPPVSFSEADLAWPTDKKFTLDDYAERLFGRIRETYAHKEKGEDPQLLTWLERQIILGAIDRLWQEHLYAMDNLRHGVYLHQHAQRDPLVEYKKEAFALFGDLMGRVADDVAANTFRSATTLQAFQRLLHSLPQVEVHEVMDQFETAQKPAASESATQMAIAAPAPLPTSATELVRAARTPPPPQLSAGPGETGDPMLQQNQRKPQTYHRDQPKVGRNDPCPCGSGKKYKKCHGADA